MDDGPTQILILALAATGGFITSALATAAETALLTVSALRRRQAAAIPESAVIGALIDEEDRLTLSLRAWNLCGKLIGAIAVAQLIARAMEAFVVAPGPWPLIGYLIGGALALVAAIIVAEIVPQSLPEESLATLALFLAPFAWVMIQAMRPLLALPLWAVRRQARRRPEGDSAENEILEIEMRAMLSLGEIEGVIEEDTRDIIEGIFSFGDSVAREVMTPRAEIFALSADETDREMLIRALRESGFKRALLYRHGLDDIVGVLDLKTMLLNPDRPVMDCVWRPLFVPENRRLLDLLADMKRSRVHFAVVLDEYGGADGVVTMDDLLNEIVGELEADATRGQEIRPAGEGAWIVSGRMAVEALNDRLDLHLPADTAHTVSGLLLATLGGLPRVGDSARFADVRLGVTRMGARRVVQARLETGMPPDADKVPAAAGAAEAAGAGDNAAEPPVAVAREGAP